MPNSGEARAGAVLFGAEEGESGKAEKSMTRLTIITDTSTLEVRETTSGSFAVTGTDGLPLTRGNFFTLDEAAGFALEVALRGIGEALGCDSDARVSYHDGTRREYVAGDLEAEQGQHAAGVQTANRERG